MSSNEQAPDNQAVLQQFFNTNTDFACGFVAIVGRPNVGKSTLMNHLIGQKISITSDKAQTTRHRVTGIETRDDAQFIFVDTPGFQTRHQGALNQALNDSVKATLKDVDCVLMVLEAGKLTDADREVLALLPQNRPVILVINKADRLKDAQALRAFGAAAADSFDSAQVLTASAKHGRGLNEILAAIRPFLPKSPPLYPEDMVTDKDLRFLLAEILREKLFRYLGEELPYSAFVEIDHYKITPKHSKIYATVYVDRPGHKAIVIGKKGERMKKIASSARLDMEKLLDKPVHLEVWVKVKGGWAEDARFLKQFEV